jgi:hypothetical protein
VSGVGVETAGEKYKRASALARMQTRAQAARRVDDTFLATVRIERWCAHGDRPANAPEKIHSAYRCGALCKT